MPQKCHDLGMFTLPCLIGEKKIWYAMLDLGDSITITPYHVYLDLKLNDLQKTDVYMKLANRSYIQPLQIFEDVLVQVKNLIFPADFYIMDKLCS